MKAYTLTRTQIVARPLEAVFPFFADPHNLARITPPWLRFRITSPGPLTMARGLLIAYVIRPFGVRQRWVSEIVEWDPPRRFTDVQRRGPYRRWHHVHEFRAVDGGTEVADCVSYALPFGLLGRAAHALIVRRQLHAIFEYRARKVRELLGP